MKDDLLQLVESQGKNFEALLALSRRMFALLETGESGGPLEVLMEERTRLFETITGLDGKLKSSVPEHEAELRPELLKLQDTVLKVVELDRKCEAILAGERSKVSGRLREMSRGSAAMKGYGMAEGKGNPSGKERGKI